MSFQDVRKRVLAEFDLNDNQPLEVGDKIIGKSEALRIIEVFRNPEELKQIVELNNSPDLVGFINGKDVQYVLEVANRTKAIPEAVQNEFAESYNRLLGSLYAKKKFRTLGTVLQFPIRTLITKPQEVDVYDGLVRKIYTDVLELEAINEIENNYTKSTKIKEIIDGYTREKASIINFLPAEYRNLRLNMSGLLLNISVSIYNGTHQTVVPKKISKFILVLDMDPELKKVAKENMRVYSDSYSKSRNNNSTSSSSGGTGRAIIWVIIIAVKLIYLMSHC